jgi:DNA topoisomerase-1
MRKAAKLISHSPAPAAHSKHIKELSRQLAKKLNPPSAVLTRDPLAAAKAAGLRYFGDDNPGIQREKDGDSFRYISPGGKAVTENETLKRIKSLAIPPAWTDVWISPLENGHLQATGRDARGRKQYRYHASWRSTRDESKFGRMMAFGVALPQIRRRVDQDLAKHGLPREKVLATVVRLLETTFIRIGNEEYARENKSFGLTTMHDRHVQIAGSTVNFRFRGKRGIYHEIRLQDRRLARIVKKCRDIPGSELFQYVDENGKRQSIDSGEINAYLREISGEDFTAKDFRTWGGTVLAAIALKELTETGAEKQNRKNVLRAIERVAEKLGNTPAICRKCYIHPAIIDSYLDGTLIQSLAQRVKQLENSNSGLQPAELTVLNLLKNRLETDPRSAIQAA